VGGRSSAPCGDHDGRLKHLGHALTPEAGGCHGPAAPHGSALSLNPSRTRRIPQSTLMPIFLSHMPELSCQSLLHTSNLQWSMGATALHKSASPDAEPLAEPYRPASDSPCGRPLREGGAHRRPHLSASSSSSCALVVRVCAEAAHRQESPAIRHLGATPSFVAATASKLDGLVRAARTLGASASLLARRFVSCPRAGSSHHSRAEGERCASGLYGAGERCASDLYGAGERCAPGLYGAGNRFASELHGGVVGACLVGMLLGEKVRKLNHACLPHLALPARFGRLPRRARHLPDVGRANAPGRHRSRRRHLLLFGRKFRAVDADQEGVPGPALRRATQNYCDAHGTVIKIENFAGSQPGHSRRTDETCSVSTEGGTRRVRLLRKEGRDVSS